MPFDEGQENFGSYEIMMPISVGEEDSLQITVSFDMGSSPHTESALDATFQQLVDHLAAFPGVLIWEGQPTMYALKRNSKAYTVTPTPTEE